MIGRRRLALSAVVATVLTALVAPRAALADGTYSLPRWDHIVVLIDENHSESGIIGNPAAPYLTALADQNAQFTQSFAVTHPSEPNYLALFSGSTQGLTDDSCPHSYTGPNLADALAARGRTFVGYSEDLPSAGYTGCSSGEYARKHNPWVNFPSVSASANQPLSAFPTDFSTLPSVSFVVPNLLDDMHDGTIAQGDDWVRTHLDAYLTWARSHNSLLVVTFDEDDRTSANRIPTILAGADVTPGSYAEPITHYSVLRTIADSFGAAPPGAAATATPIADAWAPIGYDTAVLDTFSRSTSGGWGSADTGGAYSVSAPSLFSVSGGAGLEQLGAGQAGTAVAGGLSASDVDVSMTLGASAVPAGGPLYRDVLLRRQANGSAYELHLYLEPDGSVQMAWGKVVNGVEKALTVHTVVTGQTYSPTAPVAVRVEATGATPTVLRARVWPVGGVEPSAWTLTTSDANSPLGPGSVGVWGYLSRNATNAAITASADDLVVSALRPATVDDPFTRTVASGWGSAPVGGAWTITGAGFSADGTAGRVLRATPGQSEATALQPAVLDSAELSETFSLSALPVGDKLYPTAIVRRVGSDEYQAGLVVSPSGALSLALRRRVGGVETVLGQQVVVPGITVTAGQNYVVRVQAIGANPTLVRAKVWVAGTAEPDAWLQSAPDATPSLQAAGRTGVRIYLGKNVTDAPITGLVDQVTVRALS